MNTWFSNWFLKLTAGLALETAAYSAGTASALGLCQLKEPDDLRDLVKKIKNSKNEYLS